MQGSQSGGWTASGGIDHAGTRPSVVADGLVKRFGDFTAVDGVSFEVAPGTVLGLLGPNGAGKTTTVNMLATLLIPDAGSARIAGHDVVHDRAQVRRSIMLTGQFAALDESLTGQENLVLFGRLMGLDKKAARLRAAELLEAFNLTEAAGRRVGKFSGGMRRRIDIACGLVVRPEVVFLDEPTTGLDPRSRQDVWNIVTNLRDLGITTLLTTQYLEEADLLSDNIVVIDKGRVIAEGTADELKERVSGTFCEVIPSYPDDIEKITELLADLVPRDQIRSASGGTALTVPAVRGTATLVEIVRRLDDAEIELSDVGLRRPSLDDVFLKLTAPADAEAPTPTGVASEREGAR
ncbi:ATP-binding cassette domain-containing protein [Williamsia herbipolensis]|uniref:ATP-binding cassette domain-containing protein n=1 Tax=Williamsia herbipolensis TaxID=1603258 RepID=UPI0009E20090|nr:ATP-binding cassette domain-containing protein [Williamsia herbipolensis]